jgi:hypothetical protein
LLWDLAGNWEQKLMVFENGLMRKRFGSEREDITGDWRK